MQECELKYGCNPNQKPARIFMRDGSDLPIEVLNGRPGYINFLDALNSWQLVKELSEATGMAAAASFKHVSPAGVALGTPLTDLEKQIYFVDDDAELTPAACAYIRARGADRLCSYGDWAVCLPPTGAFWGGVWYFVTKESLKNPQKKQVIADIIEYLTLNTTNEGWMYKYASGIRWEFQIGYTEGQKYLYSVASDIVMQNADGTFDYCKGQDIHKVYAQADKMVDGTKMTAYDNTINSFWQEQVREYAEGHKTKDEAIKTLKEKVKAKFSEIVVD